ncbi:MAG: hypothetical protein PHQ35_00695 [Phycisphaerae bacterium]|nr:hypothetical protein [Phycisphaerae bacterium]MDD5381417.1 hypothetical protein [Phycisphaerae bacterium]
MLKKNSYQLMLVAINFVRLSAIGVLVAITTGIVIAGGDLEVVPAALLAILFLLPAMLLYNLGCALKLKQFTCDILYFIGFLSLELFFCISLILVHVHPSGDGEDGFIVFFLYILTFIGIAVYLAETIFRTHRSIKELRHKEVLEKFNQGNISKHSRAILIGVVRSCVMAVVVVFVAATGSGFINFRLEPIFITKGIIYLTGLLPAIIIYNTAYALKLKWWKCDVLYFVAFTFAEIFFLPSAINLNVPQYVTDPGYHLSRLPIYAMAVIALGCTVVYMAEVYFRNWVVLKNLKTSAASKTGEVYSYYPVRQSLLDIGKFVIVTAIFVFIVGSVFGFVKYREQQKQDQMQTFVYQIIDSVRNQTEFYKNNAEEIAIERLNNSIGRMSGNFNVFVGCYNFGFGGHGNCQIVFENGDVFFANVEYEKGKFFLSGFVSKPSPELEVKVREAVRTAYLESIKRKAIEDANKLENENK